MYGRFANGENGQGMAIKIKISAMEYVTRMVLNFSGAVFLRLAFAEPMVMSTMAPIIKIK